MHTTTKLTKHELAMAYAPELTPKAALNRLALWINSCKPLRKSLDKTGYRVRQRNFSKRQISLIFKHLGAPQQPIKAS